MTKRLLVLALVFAAAVPAGAGPALPLIEGPDVPAVGSPVATIDVFTDERFECTEQSRTRTVAVPGGWGRVVAEVTTTPDGDPWDRLFGIAIDGVEVIRGTTPRTTMTVTRDVTEYRDLLDDGTADVTLHLGSYVGALKGSVRLLFYAEQNVLGRAAASTVVPAFVYRRLEGRGQRQAATVSLPATTPRAASVEVTMSGHGVEESSLPRAFQIVVDGVVVSEYRTMTYVYALLGFGNANANTACVGPGTSSFGDTVHPVMWWTAQRGLNAAGVHTGNGEIPPYRAEIDAEHLPLLAGARTIELVQVEGGATWLVSLSVLLH